MNTHYETMSLPELYAAMEAERRIYYKRRRFIEDEIQRRFVAGEAAPPGYKWALLEDKRKKDSES